jgi:hypothetical protein
VPAVLYFILARRKAQHAPAHLILPTEAANVGEFVSK